MPTLSHPFRPPPAAGTPQPSYDSAAPPPRENTSSSNGETLHGDDAYYSPEEVEKRARRKLKIIGGLVAVVLLYSILSTAFGDLSDTLSVRKDKNGLDRHAMALIGDEAEQTPPDHEIKKIRRDRSRAAKNAGFLDTYFCSGRRHSTFCD